MTGGPVTTFGSLRIPNYRRYFAGQAISFTGTWMQNVAIGWIVLQLSHSGVVLGAVTGARFAPLLLLGPWGGLVADRTENRRLLIVTQAISAALSAVLTVLAWRDLLSVGSILAIVLGLGLVNAFDNPTRQSFIGQLVDERRIGNAIALNSIAMSTARVVGPAISGALLATLGSTWCFFVNALSYGAVIVSLYSLRRCEIFHAERARRTKGQIVAGLHYVRGAPVLMRPLIMVAITGVLTWEFPVSIPLLTSATFHQGADGYGLATACLGVGSILGGLVAARRQSITLRSLAVSAALWGAVIVAASLAPTMPVALILLVLVGSGSITFNSSAKTLLQLASAPNMRGRVMSLWSIAWQGSTVVGAPLIGAIGSLAGARYALLTGGVGAVAVGVLVLVQRGSTETAPPAGPGEPVPEAKDWLAVPPWADSGEDERT